MKDANVKGKTVQCLNIGDRKIYATQFPDRKSKALVLEAGNVLYALAYFRNDEQVKLWEKTLGGEW